MWCLPIDLVGSSNFCGHFFDIIVQVPLILEADCTWSVIQFVPVNVRTWNQSKEAGRLLHIAIDSLMAVSGLAFAHGMHACLA